MIKPETIKKAQGYLQALNEALLKSNEITSKEIDDIAKQHKVSHDLFFWATKTGTFAKIGRGKYKPLFLTIYPIHARRAIEKRNATYSPKAHIKSDRISRNKPGAILIKPKKIIKGAHRYDMPRNKYVQPIVQKEKEKTAKKTFSFLWGLIKFEINNNEK